MTRTRGAFWLLAVLGLGVLGCGPGEGQLPTEPVSGKVTLDGKPVAGAEVWLVPAESNARVKNAKMTVRPSAKSGADGTFKLTSYVADDGAPTGDYVVIVQKAAGAGEGEEGEDADPESPRPAKGKPKTFMDTVSAMNKSRLPGKYGSPATSGLTFTVKDGRNQLDIELKSK